MFPYCQFFGSDGGPNLDRDEIFLMCHDLKEEYEVFLRRFNNQNYVSFDTITMKDLLIEELSSKRFQNFLDYFKNNYLSHLHKSMKDPIKSKKVREIGNELLRKSNHNADVHEEIWTMYTKSIALAPLNSEELAVAYGNRSYILLHFTKYEGCIQDIDRALDITKSDVLKIKLLCRKMTCLKNLGENEFKKVTWESIKTCFNTMDIKLKDEKVSQLVNKARNDLVENLPGVKKETKMSLPSSISAGTLKYNKKYGTRLIATCDIEPGKVIMSKKPYVNGISPNKFYVYCSQCLLFTWTSIPCDYCCISMYCSEKCKKEAWKKYHYFECMIMPHFNLENNIYIYFNTSIKAFIMGVNEAGSVQKLKEELKIIDELLDKTPKSYYEDGKNINFASMYSMPGKFKLLDAIQHIKHCCVFLAFIIQTSELFEGNFKLMQGKDLAKDEDIIFVGTLLFKLIMISSFNSGMINMIFSYKCRKDLIFEKCMATNCCTRGACTLPLISIIKKKCNPNAKTMLSAQGEMILYALRPIKKNDQICISCFGRYYETNKVCRLQRMAGAYKCTCQACTEDWPTIDVQELLFPSSIAELLLSRKLLPKYTLFISLNFDPNWTPDYETFYNLTKDVAEVLSTCGEPTYISSYFMGLLNIAFERLYRGNDIYVPARC